MTLFGTLFGSRAQKAENIKILSIEEFKTAVAQKGIQLVDVRTSREYKAGHIKNALNIDFFNATQFKSAFEKMDTSKPVYLYCRSGSRSQKAARRLSEMGFIQIYDLKGGYLAWH